MNRSYLELTSYGSIYRAMRGSEDQRKLLMFRPTISVMGKVGIRKKWSMTIVGEWAFAG